MVGLLGLLLFFLISAARRIDRSEARSIKKLYCGIIFSTSQKGFANIPVNTIRRMKTNIFVIGNPLPKE